MQVWRYLTCDQTGVIPLIWGIASIAKTLIQRGLAPRIVLQIHPFKHHDLALRDASFNLDWMHPPSQRMHTHLRNPDVGTPFLAIADSQ